MQYTIYSVQIGVSTDSELLSGIILRNNTCQEFFINKVIGWVLQEYSKTNPAWVRSFIDNNALSVLSIREGSKFYKHRNGQRIEPIIFAWVIVDSFLQTHK